MMSRCANCDVPTDLALTDMLTPAESARLDPHTAGLIPLVGTCGETACTQAIVERVARLDNTVAALEAYLEEWGDSLYEWKQELDYSNLNFERAVARYTDLARWLGHDY